MKAARGRRATVVAALVSSLLACSPDAFAHATLEAADPPAGTVARVAPERVVLAFSEAVEGNFGAIRVFGPDGSRLDRGGAFHPGGRSRKLAVGLDAATVRGSLTVTWRVVSADGHVVAGGHVFSIGRAGPVSGSVGELRVAIGDRTTVRAALGFARFTEFAAIAIALGAIVFMLAVWVGLVASGVPGSAAADRRVTPRIVRLVRAVAVAGIGASLLGIVAQGALASGDGLAAGFEPSTFRATLGTRFGLIWLTASFAWVLTAAGASLLGRPGQKAALLAVPLAFVASMPALSGHAAARSAPGIAAAANVVHVVAMSAWVGGVILLLAVVGPSVRGSGADGTHVFRCAMERFSPIALGCVVAIVATGTVQAALAVDSPERLLDTGYGTAILIKVGLLLALVGFGAAHRRFVIPKLTSRRDPSHGMRRAATLLLAESVVMTAVLVVTSLLASFSPVRPESKGPVSTEVHADGVVIALTIDPAGVGPNAIHMLLSDARKGAPFTKAADVTVRADGIDGGLGPFVQTSRRAGPGHWIAPGVVIPAAGRWRISVDVRVGEFDQHSGSTEVRISSATAAGGPAGGRTPTGR